MEPDACGLIAFRKVQDVNLNRAVIKKEVIFGRSFGNSTRLGP
jgi:hypothetical protein